MPSATCRSRRSCSHARASPRRASSRRVATTIAAILRAGRSGRSLPVPTLLVATGHQRGARRVAHRRGDVAVGEADAALGERVDGRRRDVAAVRGHVAVAEVVGDDDDDVGAGRCRRSVAAAKASGASRTKRPAASTVVIDRPFYLRVGPTAQIAGRPRYSEPQRAGGDRASRRGKISQVEDCMRASAVTRPPRGAARRSGAGIVRSIEPSGRERRELGCEQKAVGPCSIRSSIPGSATISYCCPPGSP